MTLGSTEPRGLTNFELICDGLLRLDPETRHQVIQAMMVLREVPVPATVRILAKNRERPRIALTCGS